MADRSKIEWTDASWNPIRAIGMDLRALTGWHCEHVSEGCRNCYAEGFNARLGTRLDFLPVNRAKVQIFVDQEMIDQPSRWRRPRMIFVGSMTDLFASFVTDAMLDQVWDEMDRADHHIFQVLTKRSARMRDYIRRRYDGRPAPAHIWIGVSAEDQANFDERVADLEETPAIVRWVSYEPLLGPIDASSALSTGMIDWGVVGGESGPDARPMHQDWVHELLDAHCAWFVPFLFKQWGEWKPLEPGDGFWPHDSKTCIRLRPDGTRGPDGWPMQRIGKKAAGRLLDGEIFDNYPARLKDAA